MLNTILDMAARVISADAYAVWRLQEDGGAWKLIAPLGLSDANERNALQKDAPGMAKCLVHIAISRDRRRTGHFSSPFSPPRGPASIS